MRSRKWNIRLSPTSQETPGTGGFWWGEPALHDSYSTISQLKIAKPLLLVVYNKVAPLDTISVTASIFDYFFIPQAEISVIILRWNSPILLPILVNQESNDQTEARQLSGSWHFHLNWKFVEYRITRGHSPAGPKHPAGPRSPAR